MKPLLAKRIKIFWVKIRRRIVIVLLVGAVACLFYVLSAPPIIKLIINAQIKQTHRYHWPKFYVPLLSWGLESESPIVHGAFKWYFNSVWGCGIVFFDDNPTNNTE
jgi:hypothetical protein